jgi:hypothetical protein
MRKALTSTAPLLLALAFPAVAQTPTGSIHGTVFDQQGRALPGASVTLTGKTGGRTVVTGGVGAYRFVALDPGRYAVQAELSGFNPKRQEGLQIGIGTQLEVDLVLGLGGVEETVEVVAEAPVVDVESSKTDNSLSQEMLFNLPLYGSWRMNYAPGVSGGSAFGADAWSSTAVLLDGVNTSDPEGGGIWVVFSERLIEEIHVGGLGAPAEFGAFTGAVVNALTKSGGNRFAGLFEALGTKEGLNSDNTSDEVAAQNPALAEATVSKLWLNLTAQLSGPIVRDKAFSS